MGNPLPRVLIVDDRPANVELLTEMLEGYDIQSALSGQEALDRLSKRPYPDLILLDVMMPGMDGYEVVRQIKSRDEIRDIPVIMVTALDEKQAKLRSLDAGAEEFISKPIDQMELQVRVRNMLRLGQLSHRLAHQNTLLEKEVAKRTAALTAEVVVRREAEQKILDLYDQDPQTHFLNYGAFVRHLQARLDELKPGQSLALILIEPSRLSVLVQSLGRGLRDQLVRQLAQRLKNSILDRDLLAHLEPGVFCVAWALDEGESADPVVIQAALSPLITQGLQAPFELQETTVQVHMRAGMVLAHTKGQAEVLLRCAEMALSSVDPDGASTLLTYTAEIGEQVASRRRAQMEIERRVGSLTPREGEVAHLIVEGNASKMIAYKLGTSVRTVDAHRARIMDKLQADTVADLVRMMLALRGGARSR